MNNLNMNDGEKNNYLKNYLIYLFSINIFFYAYFIIFGINKTKDSFSPYSSKITKININNGNYAKIGIISDLQLKSKFFSSSFKYIENNVERALKYFKKK